MPRVKKKETQTKFVEKYDIFKVKLGVDILSVQYSKP